MSTFSASIEAKIDNFQANIGKATQSIEKFSKDVGAKTSQVSDSFSNTAKKTKASTEKMSQSMKASGASMNRLSSIAKKAGTAIAGYFAFTQVIRGFKSFINTNVEFEQSLARLSSITGAVGKDLEFFKEQAVEMGAVTTLTASQVSEAFMLVGSQRPELLKSKEALAQVTKEAITLAEAASIDLPAAATALTGVLNQFKISSDKAGEAINVLAAGSKEGAADIISLNQSLANVGTVAFSAGMSIEQTVGALETLAENQIQGAEAGTALRGVIMRLQASSLGYESGVFNLSDALKEANESINSHTNAVDRDARSQEIFGILNSTAGKILTQNTERYEALTTAVTGTNTAYEQQAKNTSTLQASFKAFSSAIEGLVLSFNNSNGVIKSLVDSVTDMLNNIRENIEVWKRWGKTIGAIGATILTINLAMKAFTALAVAQQTILTVLKGGWLALNTVMKANVFVAIASAVVALGVYLYDLWQTSETFRAKFKYATEMVAYYFQVAWINIKKGAELWWVGMKAYFTAIPKLAQSAGKAIKAIFSGGNFADTLKEELNQHFENVKDNAIAVKNKYNEELSKIKIPDYDVILAKEVGVTVEDKTKEQGKEQSKTNVETEKAIVLTDELSNSLDNLSKKDIIPKGSLKELSEKLKVLYEKLDNETTQSGRVKVSRLIADLENQIARIKVNIKFELDNKNLANDSGFELKPLIERKYEDLSEMKDKFDKEVAEIAQGVQFFDNMLVGGFVNIFEGLGSAIAGGGNILGSFSKTIIGTLGDMAVKVGTLVIGFGNAAKALHAAFTSVFGAAGAVVAGGALIVLGTAVKASISGAMSGGGGSSSGGASSTFRGGYDYNNLGQSEMRGAYATQDTVTFEIKGDTLVGILEKQSSKNNRLR